MIVQKHELPEHVPEESMPYAVCLRFYAARALLMQIRHTGKVFMCDSRDVFIQKDMFEAFDDDYLHFPRESGAYRLRGPFSQNSNWITQCYGQSVLLLSSSSCPVAEDDAAAVHTENLCT